ncbi:MAG: alcohol dehydrogenase catalytic domain-containing protein [Candidatus Eremiobacteraeota bacterium]|nr:alcohol dehydrogenase catalytic domain-containing protein [Candidatus Eremiobacteraeota bacterium]
MAVVYGPDDVRIEERPVPQPQAGELLVRTYACGVSGIDVAAESAQRAPFVLGHEPAGVVAALGKGEPPVDDAGVPFAVGDRVFVHHHAPCFSCAACRRRDYVQCTTWRKSKLDPGGVAEYVRVPRENVLDTLRLPDSVSFDDATLIDATGCAVKALRRSGVRPGDVVFVSGTGALSTIVARVAQQWGARVVAGDVRAARELTEGGGPRVVLCVPGTAEAVRDALALCGAGGTVVMLNPLPIGVAFDTDLNDFYFRDLQLVASYACGPDETREALALIAEGVIGAAGVTVGFPFDEAGSAYRTLSEERKPVVFLDPTLQLIA